MCNHLFAKEQISGLLAPEKKREFLPPGNDCEKFALPGKLSTFGTESGAPTGKYTLLTTYLIIGNKKSSPNNLT